jgi:formylglycine-generating enzyme required for sulfatase activity
MHAVGEKPPNSLGLFDMHGNVWEWCGDDWSESYDESSDQHPAAFRTPGGGARDRVFRGGSCFNTAGYARSASRSGWGPGVRGANLGFRPASLAPE